MSGSWLSSPSGALRQGDAGGRGDRGTI